MTPEREQEIRELAERLAQPGTNHGKIARVLAELLAALDEARGTAPLSPSELRRRALLEARFAGPVTRP